VVRGEGAHWRLDSAGAAAATLRRRVRVEMVSENCMLKILKIVGFLMKWILIVGRREFRKASGRFI